MIGLSNISLSGIKDVSKGGPPILVGGDTGNGLTIGSSNLCIDKKLSLGDSKGNRSNGRGIGVSTGGNGTIGCSIGKGLIGTIGCSDICGKLPIGFTSGAIGSIRATGSLDKFSISPLFLNALFKNPMSNSSCPDNLQKIS
jgi:hypothetical protein